MPGELQTRMVFIDTSVFFSRNFNIKGTEFASLKDRVNAGTLKLILTDVTVRELEAHIEKKFNEVVETLTTATNKAKFARNLALEISELQELCSELETGTRLEALKYRLRQFLADLGTEILTVDVVPASKVLDLYFGRNPPFGTGKKKHEFPDAFALATLQNWCEEKGEKVYVVSEDSDMEAICADAPEVLLHVAVFSKLLELALQDEDARRMEWAHALLSKTVTEIRERIRAAFEELGIIYLTQQHASCRLHL